MNRLTWAMLAIASSVSAMDSTTVGPRALGMGGAGVAASDSTAAQFYNPALYGFFSLRDGDDKRLACDPNDLGRKDWGLGLVDATAGYEIRGRLADYVQQLDGADIARLSTLDVGSVQPKDLETATLVLGLIGNFDPQKDFIIANANAGALGIRILHFGVGLRVFSQALLSVADKDLYHIGFGSNATNLVNNLDTATPAGWTSSYVPTIIVPGSAAYSAIAAASPGNAADVASKLEYSARQAGLSDAEIANMAAAGGSLTNAVANAGTTTYTDNTTAAFAAGYVLAEVPVTFGWPVTDWLAVGGSAKLMAGRTAAAKTRLVGGTDSLGTYLQDAIKNGERTITGGLDLGVAARGSWWQAGVAARNLNRPVLKGGEFKDADGQPFLLDDIAIEPQVALGVAVYPWTTFTLTGDIDLTESRTRYSTTSQRTGLAPGADPTLTIEYRSRKARAGAEWDVLRFLALRGGISTDLADGNSPTQVHLGAGLNLWAIRLDLAGSMATEKVTVNGKDVPRAAEASAGLTIDF